MKRMLSDWLAGYIEYTKNTEPPLSYHIWVGISTIAAALERKVYMKWGHSDIYPNQYIVLIGPSGQSRKGEAVNLARNFIDHIGVNVGAQKVDAYSCNAINPLMFRLISPLRSTVIPISHVA